MHSSFHTFPWLSFSEKTEKLPDHSFSFTLQNQIIRFTSEGDLLDIQLSHNCYDVIKIDKTFHNQAGIPLMRMEFSNDLLSDSSIRPSPYKLHRSQTDTTATFSFSSSPLASGIKLVKEYTFHKNNYTLVFSGRLVYVDPGTITEKYFPELQFTFPDDIRNGGDLVYLGKKVQILNNDKLPETDTLKADDWTGIHNRFWGCFIQSDGSNLLLIRKDGSFEIGLSPSSGLKIYYGPIVYDELKKADHHLGRLLYRLPFWMRWLSFGFLFVFDVLLKVFRNVPLSLLLLSVCVKIVLAPLFKLASIWQKQVNRQSSLLQPRLDEIKRKYKGEEQTRKTLEAYKELGISPLYSLKSLLSAAIQIPVFFAAYHMLSEHIALSNTSFLWIKDLSFPDHFFTLYQPFWKYLMFFHYHDPYLRSPDTTDPSFVSLQKREKFTDGSLFFFALYITGRNVYLLDNEHLDYSPLFEFNAKEKRKETTISNSKLKEPDEDEAIILAAG